MNVDKYFWLVYMYIYIATLKICDTTKESVYGWQYIRCPMGFITLAKEFTAAARKMLSSSNELSTLVTGKV